MAVSVNVPFHWCIIINEVTEVIGHYLRSDSCLDVGEVARVTSYHTYNHTCNKHEECL